MFVIVGLVVVGVVFVVGALLGVSVAQSSVADRARRDARDRRLSAVRTEALISSS